MAVQGSETIRAKIAASQTIFADTMKGMARFQSARRVPSVQSLVPAAAKQECVTRADYFAQFTDFPAPYLQYDNGYRSWSYTYAQAGAAARAFSAKLYAEGVTKGDKIILWSENRPEWVAAFWGCVISGVIVVPIDYRGSAEFLQRVKEKVSARVILIGDEVRSPSWEKQPAVWRLSELDRASTGVASGPVSLQPNDIAEILFTLGATGEPRGVLINHRNIRQQITRLTWNAVSNTCSLGRRSWPRDAISCLE